VKLLPTFAQYWVELPVPEIGGICRLFWQF
jgi:hypothetical protein